MPNLYRDELAGESERCLNERAANCADRIQRTAITTRLALYSSTMPRDSTALFPHCVRGRRCFFVRPVVYSSHPVCALAAYELSGQPAYRLQFKKPLKEAPAGNSGRALHKCDGYHSDEMG